MSAWLREQRAPAETILPWLGPHQGPCLKPHAVSSQESGGEGQDVFMFSCRLRVELVAAGSRSPCVSIGGNKKSASGKQLAPQHGHVDLRPQKGPNSGKSLTAPDPMSSAYLNFFCL